MSKHIDLNLRITFSEEVNFTREQLHEVMHNLAAAIIDQADHAGVAPHDHSAITKGGVMWHDSSKLWTSFSVTPVDIQQGWKFAGDPNDPDHRYVIRDGGLNCPFCHGGDTTQQERPAADGRGATCTVKCENCGKTWREVWRLVGICDVDGNDFKPGETK